MIESFGCGVGVAKHGLDAIQRLREQDFDLIFMDCQMPEMDGYETTRYVRRQPGLFNIPIIALTAAAFPEDLERCRDAGMDDHLSKPVSKESLHRAIVRWSRGAAAKNAPHLRQ
jgi:CheY-like chemotaxis protein